MRNDRLIKKLLDSGLMSTDPETGAVHYKGRVRGYTCKSYEYLTFTICNPRGGRRRIRCHRVVWIAAHGLPKYGMEVDHTPREDGTIDKADNRLKYLELVTCATNIRRAHANGLCDDWGSKRDPATGQYIKDLEEAPF